MSHLKVQKMLFYVQALHLAYFETPIIDDDFEAWLHGPVSRKVFNEIKDLSRLHDEITFAPEQWSNNLTPDVLVDGIVTPDQKELIDEIIDKYGTLTASQLENLTHSEEPWIQAREGYGIADICDVIISKQHILGYYKGAIYGAN